MDKRIVLTKRQMKLIRELRKNLHRLSEMNADWFVNFDDFAEKLTIAFYNAENVYSYEDAYLCDKSVDDSSCVLDPNELSHLTLHAIYIGNDPMLLLENNQYVKDRIIDAYKVIEKKKLQEAFGSDGYRLQSIKKEIKERAKADKELHEELDRWISTGNDKMIEITLADIAANNCRRNELKSEAIKLGRIVAQKKREFLKNKGW